jgi:hypothetical protein
VSVVDLSEITDENLTLAMHKYYFLDVFPSHKSVFLILKPECYGELLSWTVVPYLEAGFKHSIPVDCIDQAIFVDVTVTPDPFLNTLSQP